MSDDPAPVQQSPPKGYCSGCIYFDASGGKNLCRFLPPTVQPMVPSSSSPNSPGPLWFEFSGFWPTIPSPDTDWCGEWANKWP